MKLGEFELAVIDVITFIGILITFITGVLNLCQNKKTLYINNITRFRVIWISTFRGHIATLKELSNITNLYISTKEGANKISYRRELEKIVSLIKMDLNFSGKLDMELLSKVEKLKAIINSYLLMHYCKNTIKNSETDTNLGCIFDDVLDGISERQVLEEFLYMLADCKDKIVLKDLNLLELKTQVKLSYSNNHELINRIVEESNFIINRYENEIDELNNEIDRIVQIYLKAEWIRCKVETKIWPYNKYDEEKIINILEKKYSKIK